MKMVGVFYWKKLGKQAKYVYVQLKEISMNQLCNQLTSWKNSTILKLIITGQNTILKADNTTVQLTF